MPRTTEEILAHANELAGRFEDFNPTETEEVDAIEGLTRAVVDAANAQKLVELWVTRAREQRKSWADIGKALEPPARLPGSASLGSQTWTSGRRTLIPEL